MKRLLLACSVLLTAVGAFAQGQINFANTSTTLITTTSGGTTASISGAGNYTIGFYAGPAGSAESALTLAGTALNGALAGRFSGGNPYPLPSPTYPAGTTIAFQVRAWSTAAGSSYEAALASGNAGNFAGKSAVGSVSPTAPPATVPGIFGVGAGQVGGFTLTPVPEPSSIALGLLGLGAVALFRRRK